MSKKRQTKMKKKNNSKKMGGEEPKIKDEITKKKGAAVGGHFGLRGAPNPKKRKNGKKNENRMKPKCRARFFCLLLELEGVAFQYLCGTFLGRRHLELELLS